MEHKNSPARILEVLLKSPKKFTPAREIWQQADISEHSFIDAIKRLTEWNLIRMKPAGRKYTYSIIPELKRLINQSEDKNKIVPILSEILTETARFCFSTLKERMLQKTEGEKDRNCPKEMNLLSEKSKKKENLHILISFIDKEAGDLKNFLNMENLFQALVKIFTGQNLPSDRNFLSGIPQNENPSQSENLPSGGSFKSSSISAGLEVDQSPEEKLLAEDERLRALIDQNKDLTEFPDLKALAQALMIRSKGKEYVRKNPSSGEFPETWVRPLELIADLSKNLRYWGLSPDARTRLLIEEYAKYANILGLAICANDSTKPGCLWFAEHPEWFDRPNSTSRSYRLHFTRARILADVYGANYRVFVKLVCDHFKSGPPAKFTKGLARAKHLFGDTARELYTEAYHQDFVFKKNYAYTNNFLRDLDGYWCIRAEGEFPELDINNYEGSLEQIRYFQRILHETYPLESHFTGGYTYGDVFSWRFINNSVNRNLIPLDFAESKHNYVAPGYNHEWYNTYIKEVEEAQRAYDKEASKLLDKKQETLYEVRRNKEITLNKAKIRLKEKESELENMTLEQMKALWAGPDEQALIEAKVKALELYINTLRSTMEALIRLQPEQTNTVKEVEGYVADEMAKLINLRPQIEYNPEVNKTSFLEHLTSRYGLQHAAQCS